MHHRDTRIPVATAGLMLLAVLFTAACGGAPATVESPAEPALTSPPPVTKTIAPAPSAAPSATEPEANRPIAAMAQEELALRIGVPVAEITVLSVEAVDWPDASLGCPEPGMMYAQAITPGYRVILEAGGEEYEVHTDGGQAAVVCEEEAPAMEVTPESGSVDAGLSWLIEMAREDLAQRLSILADQIEILEAKAVVWPDASLGCPQPGMRYRQVPMDGALVRLGAEGQVYEYHSGGGRAPFLCEQPLNLQKAVPTPIDLLKLTPTD